MIKTAWLIEPVNKNGLCLGQTKSGILTWVCPTDVMALCWDTKGQAEAYAREHVSASYSVEANEHQWG